MPNYSVFGGCLCSELSFPELRPSHESIPQWTLRRSNQPPASPCEELLGALAGGYCEVALHKTRSGFRLRHVCTGQYDISANGCEIVWTPAGQIAIEFAQNDLTGRVMPVALHAGGMLCMHGSGVLLDGVALAFLADSGYGKSTLAFALMRAGAQLISDDALAIDATHPVTVRPGVNHLRLCRKTADRLLGHSAPAGNTFDGKYVVDCFEAGRLMLSPAPLAAIYLLSPFKPDLRDSPARRTRMPPLPAAIALIRHSKIGVLLGGSEAAVVLDRAVTVAREVPVYTLHIARDLSRLGDVVAQLADWHSSASSPAGIS